MRSLLPDLLPRIEAHRLPGLDAGPGAVYPYYAGLSLANLPSSICRWVGAPGLGAPPLDPAVLGLYPREFRQVILLVVDGMGLNTLQTALSLSETDPDFAVWAALAAEGALAPLTSIAPSTTAAALTTLWTGVTPAEHGVMGYEVWLKEYGLIANMILHSPASYTGEVGSLRRAGFNPETFLPVPTLGPHLQAHRVKPHAFQHQSIAWSGLSTMLLPGVAVHPFRSQSDLWVSLDELLETTAGERSYIYIYWGDLDEHSHRFGPADPRVALEMAAFSRQLAYFIRRRQARRGGDTLLLITADHGHIATPPRPDYALSSHPDLLDLLVMVPSGEARLPYVYVRPGREDAFLRYVAAAWPGQFRVLPSAQAVEAGLFGGPGRAARLAERVGDYIVIPQTEAAYWAFSDRANLLRGRHGGLSRTEMLTPLFALAL